MQDILSWISRSFEQNTTTPRYIQLAQIIEQAVEEKLLPAGNFLPPERSLAEGLKISRGTVSKAMLELERKGVVLRRQGAGTSITKHLDYSLDDGGFTVQMKNSGGDVTNRWILRAKVAAPAHIAKHLNLPTGTTVAKLKRVRLLDYLPTSLETTHIPLQFLPKPEALEHSLYAFWHERGIIRGRKHYKLALETSTPEIDTILNITNIPLWRVEQTTYDSYESILEYSETLCRGDLYQFEINI